MAEYIEREATCGDCIHSEICEHMPTLTGWDALNPAYCRTFKNAADVVAVVRCKECKYYGDTAYGDMCKRWEDWLPTEDDDFCSYGEKRGAGGE